MAKDIVRLDADARQEVSYAIPLWLRDEQIKLSITRVKGRIQPNHDKHTEPIAVVCFGPSLNDTWEEIKQFKYVISCSGAHKFIVGKGIIPNWHVEVDPRPHKTELIGKPCKETEYLIASTCHPKVFDHLEGYDVKLWHVFDSKEEGFRILPQGEWALTGGPSVGLRAMVVARFLGFTEQHVFGMDGCEGVSGKHASAHPLQPTGQCITEYDGKDYYTTPSMLECAKATWHELDVMHDVNAVFHGEGLVQHMARNYIRKPVSESQALIGFNKPELISAEYRELNKKLHKDKLQYGAGGGEHAEVVQNLVRSTQSQSVLDYGCGKSYLSKSLPFPIWEYDPAVPGKEGSPRPADLVACFNVLEHVEPEKLLFVLDDLRRCVQKVGYFIIDTTPATKYLADGRNAHLIQENHDWWYKKLNKLFTVGKIFIVGPALHVIVAPKIARNLEAA